MTTEEIFDPDFLRRLRSLFFRLRRRRQLDRKGIQPTTAVGVTREFKDHRAYTSRDDYRTIDWRVFARLEKLFIRIFEEIQEFHVHVVIDRSLSMHEPFPRKRVTALRLGVALAYLALMNQHRVSVTSVGEDLRTEIPPRRGQGHIHGILQHLLGLEFGGESRLEECFHQLRPGRGRRGIVFFLSDLLTEDPEEALRALPRAVSWRAETHFIHILDPQEIDPPLDGEVRLVDVETGETRRLALTRRDLERYREVFSRHREALAQECLTRQLDYVPWTTDLSFERAFLGLLSRGSALSHG